MHEAYKLTAEFFWLRPVGRAGRTFFQGSGRVGSAHVFDFELFEVKVVCKNVT